MHLPSSVSVAMPLSFRLLDSRPKQDQGEWAYSVTPSSTRALSWRDTRRRHSNKKWDCVAGCRIERHRLLPPITAVQFKCQIDVGGRYRLNFGCMRFKTLPPSLPLHFGSCSPIGGHESVDDRRTIGNNGRREEISAGRIQSADAADGPPHTRLNPATPNKQKEP